MARPAGTWCFAQMFFSADGKVWSSDFWFDGAGAARPSGFDVDLLAQTFWGYCAGAFAPMMNTAYSIIGAEIQCNFGTGTFGGKYYGVQAGSNSNVAAPEDVCVVVTKESATGGVSHAGRWRFSGLCVDSINGSYLSTTGTGFVGPIAAGLESTFADQGVTWTPQIYSRKLNVFSKIVGTKPELLLGTCRRRRPRF